MNASYSDFQNMLAKYADRDGVLAVGHNPNVFQFLGRLITGNGGASIRMRKGSIARVDMERHPPRLQWLLDPRTARINYASATKSSAEAILKTIGEIYRIKESSQEAVSVISSLGSRIEAIGQIVNVIDDVAEQTNLLALNAAIIAAQAGEQGKGFAVVADEIEDLAERAGASTREITDLIKTVQAESKNAITAVERGAHNVDRGVEVSNEAERALKKILESSQKSTNMVRAIARATVEQAKGSKQVTDAIGRIAETVQQIAAATAQQARGSELIMRSAEKMRIITQHVERSSQEQARGGRQISSAIETISSMVGSSTRATRRSRAGASSCSPRRRGSKAAPRRSFRA